MKLQLIVSALCLTLFSFVAGKCCNPHMGCGKIWCCGVGNCNIFCCNCDGGCVGDRWPLDELLHHDPHVLTPTEKDAPICHDKFRHVDLNGDGKLTFLEWATQSVGVSSLDSFVVAATHWEKFDVEGKGYLTEEEAFTRLA